MLVILSAGILAQAAAGATVPLFTNLGTHHYAITALPRAQQYFDQGLRLTWAFNHAEAVRAYQQAIRIDSTCAMCWWGIAYALGPNINAPMDSVSTVRAVAAIRRARSLAGNKPPKERMMIDALSRRYVGAGGRDSQDSAWARTIGAVADQYPDDDEAQTLAADAAMNLNPWNYWTENGSPRPGTQALLARLERVIARSPNHPGACHLYIHAVESVVPEKGVACAERLAALMPGAGHLVHMPAHIYVRVGRWADAVEANHHAVHADEAYIAAERPTGLYPGAYYPHNYHFLAYAATFAGMSREAIDAATAAAAHIPLDVAREVPWTQPIVAFRVVTLQVFGKWDLILADPLPSADLPLAHVLARYARGMAYAAKGRMDDAVSELEAIRVTVPAVPEGELRTTAEIAQHLLIGELGLRAGEPAQAIIEFETAKRLEDGLPYNEPPYWHQPVRHTLGAALLGAGRAAEAEKAYREDLARFPGNGWSMFGLAAALRQQGKTAEATAVDERFRAAWKGADVTLVTSRF